jgi:CheY-like chemotaxis protein
MNENCYALVIEDSRSIREFVSQILQQGAHIDHVVEADDPDHALELIEQQAGQPLLVVSDINMPGMPIEEFVQVIKARPEFTDTALFLLTGSCKETAESLAEEVPIHGILTKPFEADSLLTLVEEHVGIEERRRATRATPLQRCAIDLGFDDSHPAFSAEVVNISETGIQLRAPLPLLGAGYIYDFTSLVLQPEDGEEIEVYAQIVRLEADRQSVHNGDPRVLMALDFGRLNEPTLNRIRSYVLLNDSDTGQPQH